MSLINISHLTFGYEGSFDLVFEDVSFQIDTDWKLGMTGRNGKGKTTLMQLLMGKYPHQGTISASVEFAYFPCLRPDPMALAYQVAEEITPDYEWWRLIRELNLLEVEEERLYQPFDTLSGGEQTKIMLASLFLREGRFLLIDEPTNHLDQHGRKMVARYLNRKRGFLLVSHDQWLLDECTDHTVALTRTSIQIQKGNFSSWWENKQRQDQFEQAENAKLHREIRHMDEAAKKTADWSTQVEATKNNSQRVGGLKPDKGHVGHMAAKMMKRSKSAQQRRQRALDEKKELLKDLEVNRDLKLTPLVYRRQRLIWAENLCMFYGSRQICQPIRFSLEPGECMAIQGVNGSGKSSLLSLLWGEPTEGLHFTGTLQTGSQMKISRVMQDTSWLAGNLSDFARNQGIDESRFKTILRYLDVSRSQFEKPMEEFSQGQKKKVLLASSLCQEAHLYIWDEPLNFVDIFSRMQLAQLLRTADVTMILVEHDQAFLESLNTRTLEIRKPCEGA